MLLSLFSQKSQHIFTEKNLFDTSKPTWSALREKYTTHLPHSVINKSGEKTPQNLLYYTKDLISKHMRINNIWVATYRDLCGLLENSLLYIKLIQGLSFKSNLHTDALFPLKVNISINENRVSHCFYSTYCFCFYIVSNIFFNCIIELL